MRPIDRSFGHRLGPWLALRRGFAILVVAIAMIAGVAAPSAARSEKTLAYLRDQVWPTAVRFLVVDEHVKITEKDAEAGYVLFELRDDGKPFRGSLEVMTVVRDGRSLVRCVLQIADRPSWVEIAMLTRLETKLRAELGAPSPPPSQPDPDPPRKDEPKPDRPAPDGPKDGGGPPVSWKRAQSPAGSAASVALSRNETKETPSPSTLRIYRACWSGNETKETPSPSPV